MSDGGEQRALLFIEMREICSEESIPVKVQLKQSFRAIHLVSRQCRCSSAQSFEIVMQSMVVMQQMIGQRPISVRQHRMQTCFLHRSMLEQQRGHILQRLADCRAILRFGTEKTFGEIEEFTTD